VKRFVSLLLFLVLAEDWGCIYAQHLAAPLAWVHGLLIDALPIKVRPIDVILLVVIIIQASGQRDGRPPHVAPMKNVLFLLLGVTVFDFAYGVLHGGDVRAASWQTYLILSSVNLAFAVASTFRTPDDYRGLAKWLVAAAVYRAVWCWISYFTWGKARLGDNGVFFTTHDFDRRKITLRNVALVVLFLGAIQFNSRRIAWVSLAMGLVAMYFLYPKGQVKRRITRYFLFASPVALAYVVVGWGSQSNVFAPLRSFATVSTQEDGSTLARNAENLGLIATANAYGLGLGSGWGKPYIYLTLKYDIAGAFDLWQYVPHNSILGLLAFTGIVGSGAFWVAVATSVFLSARVARMSTDASARAVAIVGVAQVVVSANQLYGDMGIFFFKPMYVLGISYAMAMRLPTAAGVWNAPSKR
jgi:hypothetical protein